MLLLLGTTAKMREAVIGYRKGPVTDHYDLHPLSDSNDLRSSSNRKAGTRGADVCTRSLALGFLIEISLRLTTWQERQVNMAARILESPKC